MNFYQSMRVMKITMILLTCFLLQANAASYAQKVTINKQNSSVQSILEEIRRQTQYDFFYDMKLFDKLKPISIQLKDVTIDRVLSTCFEGKAFTYTIKRNMVVITSLENSDSQSTKEVVQQLGRIAGKIVDNSGNPLPGASVKIVQNGKGTQSKVDGTYSLDITDGNYTIEVSFISFQTKRITDVEVKSAQLTNLDVVLNPITNNLEQVVVTASYKSESIKSLYNRQKNDASISNGISREQIASLPDKNIGEVLKRISGVSTTDNRRVVVRGIAERYNLAMMDGATLPSTDVQVRDFEFDIIPSNLVDNVVVSKSATPDMSFGFGGGLIQINTMAIPNQNFMNFSMGSKYINGSTGKEFLGYQRGKTDYLGFDDGGRNHFPKDILVFNLGGNYNAADPYATNPLPGVEKITPAMVAEQNKRIGGTERFGTRIFKTAPGQNYQFSLGRTYGLKNSRFGFVGSLSYRNEQAIDNIPHFERGAYNKLTNSEYDPITNEQLKETNAVQYNFNTNLGALVNLGWNSKNHKITLRNFYSRSFSNKFFRIAGWGEDIGYEDGPAIREYDRPKFIDLLQNRISGEHSLGKFKFEWGVARNRVNNHEQDAVDAELGRAEIVKGSYNYFYGVSNLTMNPGPLSRSSFKYIESNWQADASLSYKFTFKNLAQTFKAGYQYMDKKGDFAWTVLPIGVAKGFTNAYTPVQTWNIDFKNPLNDIFYYPADYNNNNYTGENNNQAIYGMFDNRFTSWIRLVWGIRAERYKYNRIKDTAADKVAKQEMLNMEMNRYVDPETGNIVHKTLDASADEKEWLYMPSAHLTITPIKDFNIRASYSKSAVRPALIENSSFARYNYLYGRIQRNTGVISTIISSYDTRLEWYPSAGEVISVGYFNKHFKNPVEMYLDVNDSSGKVDLYTTNSDYADVNGFEFDFRKNFAFINSGWRFLSNIYLSGNLTLQNSEVQASAFRYSSMGLENKDIDGKIYTYRTKTYLRDKRPLYGQVPVLYNIALQYVGNRLSANVAFNHAGYKTFTVGMEPAYVEMERPRNQLDAQIGYKFLKNKKLETRLNISNLLNSPYRYFINASNTYQTKPDAQIMTMKEWSDVYEWKEGFSYKYEKGYYENSSDGKLRHIGDIDTFIRKIGTSFSLSLSYNL